MLVEPAEVLAASRPPAAETAGSAPLAVASIRETLRRDMAVAFEAATERELSKQE